MAADRRERESPIGFLNLERDFMERMRWDRKQGRENDYWMSKDFSRDFTIFSSRDPRDFGKIMGSLIGIAVRRGRDPGEYTGSVIWRTEERDAPKGMEKKTDERNERNRRDDWNERRRERDWGPRRDDTAPPHGDDERP